MVRKPYPVDVYEADKSIARAETSSSSDGGAQLNWPEGLVGGFTATAMVSGALSVTSASPAAILRPDMGQSYGPGLDSVGAHHDDTNLSRQHIDPTIANQYLDTWNSIATWDARDLDEIQVLEYTTESSSIHR